ncbi:MAG: hypothetical protein Kow00107_05490 [Planctomycetota bacterium]
MRAVAAVLPILLMLAVLASAEEVSVKLTTVSGKTLSGALSFADGSFKVTGRDTNETVKGELVDRIDLPPYLEMPEDAYHCAVMTRHGDVFDGYFADLALEDAVAFSVPSFGYVDIQWTSLKGVMFYGLKRSKSEETALKDRIMSADPELDEIGLANGDVLNGAVIEIASRGALAEVNGKHLSIPAEELRYVIFAKLEETEPDTVWHCGVRTTFNNYFKMTISSIAEGKLKGKMMAGDEVTIGLEKIVSIEFFNGAAIRLTTLKPSAVEYKPFFHKSWPWKLNKSVSGGPLRMKGKTWQEGIGTHSYTKLDYKLDGGFTDFTAVVGIDDGAGGKGSVVFRVLGDGKTLFETPVMKSGSVEAIRASVTDVEILSLVTDYGGDDDLGDHGNWCDPKLIRKVE